MTTRHLTVSTTLIFVLLNALIWLAFGAIIALNAHPALPDISIIKGSMAALSLTIGGILVALYIFLGRRSRMAYFLALALFAGATFLTLFDDFGLFDLVVVAVNLIPMVLLVKDRRWYLGAAQS